MKMIKELWRGNLDPIARFSVDVREIKNIERLKERNRERLFGMLNDDEKVCLEKFNDSIDEYLCAMCEQAFYEGYCIGAKMSFESLTGAEHILKRDCCL